MNRLLAIPAVAVLGLSGCESLNAPISSSEYNPLSVPGSGPVAAETSRVNFKPGQYVRTSMQDTGFFRSRPRGNADADRLLGRETRMKVVSSDSSYVRVELDSGEVGFVPAVMVEDISAPADELPPSSGNEFQVYPPIAPVTGFETPTVDPSELPPDDSVPSLMNLETPELPDADATPVGPLEELPPSAPAMEDELPPSSPGVDELPPSSPGSDLEDADAGDAADDAAEMIPPPTELEEEVKESVEEELDVEAE